MQSGIIVRGVGAFVFQPAPIGYCNEVEHHVRPVLWLSRAAI
jgi:hypothetical protein